MACHLNHTAQHACCHRQTALTMHLSETYMRTLTVPELCMNEQYVLARIFGTNDALFSRDDEQRIFRQVAEVGLGPKLLVRPATEATPCSL